ncbi:MAG: hypothetical protein JXB15_06870 [Anaerolineales bacterium]|nr:hypothetical protein [Anaerolineales bacterium]
MKKFNPFFACLAALSLLLGACKMPAPSVDQPTQADPQAMFTAAAQTADAMRSQLVINTPTLPIESVLATSAAPTPTELSPSPTPTGPVVATVIVPTSLPASTDDKAEFEADVSVPDGTYFAPNEAFTKTWRLKNSGTSTWTSAYSLYFVSGALMGAPASVPVPKDVPPGESVEITVDLIAPTEPGIYQGFWKLRNASGQVFGVGPTASDAIWVTIGVSEASGGASSTTTASGLVTQMDISVDKATISGACPQTFNFTITFTLSSPATVTYALEVGSDAGFEVKLPPPTTRNMDAGVHTVVYQLTFSNSLKGWARLRISAPETAVSKQVDFALVCQ